MNSTDDSRSFLRHTVATLAYRGGKAIRDAPADFGERSAGSGARTALQIVGHLGDLFDWALSMARGAQAYHVGECGSWQETSTRFFASLEAFDAYLASEAPIEAPVERLFQGPVADALTHVGQLTLMRRLAGAPIRGENYFVADIQAGRVGQDQPAARREFD